MYVCYTCCAYVDQSTGGSSEGSFPAASTDSQQNQGMRCWLVTLLTLISVCGMYLYIDIHEQICLSRIN